MIALVCERVVAKMQQFRELQAFTREALMLDNSIMRLTTG
jgi:hypothetical protein